MSTFRLAVALSTGALVALTLIVLMGQGPAGATFNVPDSTPGVVSFMGIDADPSGNTATQVVGVETTRTVPVGDTFEVDVVIDEIDPTNRMGGLQANVLYDPAVVRIDSADGDFLLTSIANHGILVNFSEAVPDTNGNFLTAFVTSGNPANTDFADGEGVGIRLTLTCMSSGVSPLNLTQVLIADPVGNLLTVQQVGDAVVGCGMDPPLPTPQPTPSQEPTPTPEPSPVSVGGAVVIATGTDGGSLGLASLDLLIAGLISVMALAVAVTSRLML